jgi:hypothetical protein
MVIGIGAYAFSRPKEGSVRWHVSEYADAGEKMRGRNWFASLKAFYHRTANKVLGRRGVVASQDLTIQFRRSEEARLALHRLGFLAVRQFTVTNATTVDVAARVWKELAAGVSPEEEMFIKFSYSERNVLQIEGVAANMHKWEAAVRRADVAGK